MNKKSIILFVFSLMLGATMTLSARSATITFQPNPVDMQDLPHERYYLWKETLNLPSAEYITGATLLFKNIYNSEGGTLFTNLLDNPSSSGWNPVSSDLWYKGDINGGGDNFLGQGILIGQFSYVGQPQDLTYNFSPSQIN
jgi:hypothetical protein